MRISELVPFLLVAGVIAAPNRRAVTHVLHERRTLEPLDWVQDRRLDASMMLPMRFGLAQQNMDRLEELLLEVSHPESPKYGQHYTPAQVVDTFAPSMETISAVTDWLVESGITRERLRLAPNRAWIHVNATTAEVEDLLKTEYHVFTHSSGEEQIGCHNYSVPAHIKEHIEIIKPTVYFDHHPGTKLSSKLRKRKAAANRGAPFTSSNDVVITPSLETCDQITTPDCLRALYSINYKPVATHENTYGIVELTPQAFLPGDLDMFFANFSPTQVGQRPNTVLIDGAVLQTVLEDVVVNGESDLDLEYAMTLSNPQPITLLQTGDLVQGGSFNNWLDAVDGSFCTFEGGDDPAHDGVYPDPLPGGFKGNRSCGIISPPHTVSVSFLPDESTFTAAYAIRQCTEYAKLGLMGTTVFHSSGDNGVAGNGGVCLNADHQPDVNGTVFNPGFPATCPYVTAVGATQINPNSTVNDSESACEEGIFSGGGFSNIFPMPSFQAAYVTSYLKENPPPFADGHFNNSGNARAYPDISANGANYILAVDGKFQTVSGTSASSPVVGSIITLLNDARIAAGKKPVGFLNPLIYSPLFRSAFNDITLGGNPGCGSPGFTAAKGWDPVTGVGTPNLSKLISLALLLP